MKIPRWLVVSLLTVSTLAALGAGAWSWVTWPDRTMREFSSLLKKGNVNQADRMMDWGDANADWQSKERYLRRCASEIDFSGMRRGNKTIGEMLRGRAVFLVRERKGAYWG